MSKEKTPQQWTPEQKLQAVIDCASMDSEQLSAWCRENGIFPHHVKTWRKEFTESSKKPSGNSRLKQLSRENKSLASKKVFLKKLRRVKKTAKR